MVGSLLARVHLASRVPVVSSMLNAGRSTLSERQEGGVTVALWSRQGPKVVGSCRRVTVPSWGRLGWPRHLEAGEQEISRFRFSTHRVKRMKNMGYL